MFTVVKDVDHALLSWNNDKKRTVYMNAKTTWFHYTVKVNVISVPIDLILIYEVLCFRKNSIIISNLLHHSACAYNVFN